MCHGMAVIYAAPHGVEIMVLQLAQFEFSSPQRWSALAIVLVVLLAGAFSLLRHARGHRLAMTACRALAVTLLVLAWAGLFWRGTTTQQFIVLADDQSDSAAQREGNSQAAVDFDARLEFGGKTSSARMARASESPQRESLESLASDLGLAVCRAAALVPAERVGQIVLYSDGRETRERLLAAAKAQGMPVHVIVKPPFPEPEVCVAEVSAPQSAKAGATFRAEVVVTSNHDDTGRLELVAGDVHLPVRAVQLTAGENRTAFDVLFPSGASTLTLRAALSGCQDRYEANNVRRAVVTAAAEPQVLLVDHGSGRATIAKELATQGIDVTSASAEQIPTTPALLARYDAVILSDIAPQRVGPSQREAVAQFVRNGGGLIVWGGERMFSLPCPAVGWKNFCPFPRLKRRRRGDERSHWC